MIYLTGDTHIPYDIGKLSLEAFPEQKQLSRSDYVIVLGDFGLLWRRHDVYETWLRDLSQRNFTLLWLDGNHENFDWLARFPSSKWHGGSVQFLSENILHLQRGQIFTIDGHTFFVMGGASSQGKNPESRGVDWWPQEVPSTQEIEEGLANLRRAGGQVDYVLTHTCPYDMIEPMFHIDPKEAEAYGAEAPTERALMRLQREMHYRAWFFGHWHMDVDAQEFHCLYQRIWRLDE